MTENDYQKFRDMGYDHITARKLAQVVEDVKDQLSPQEKEWCVCGNPQSPGVVHRQDGPCYVKPTAGEEFCTCPEVTKFSCSGGLPLIHIPCGKRIKSPSEPKPAQVELPEYLKTEIPLQIETNHFTIYQCISNMSTKINEILDYLRQERGE